MFRYNPARTGTTSSTASNTNKTVWISAFTYSFSNLKRPIVVDGKVLVIDYTVIKAVDETTGVLLWSSLAFPNALEEMAYADKKLYVACRNGFLYCVDATTGEKLWEYQATASGQIQSSPAVVNGKVYFGTTDNYLYALDASTGLYKWRYTAGGPIYSSPTVVGDLLYFGCDNYRLYALNISGSLPSLKWYYETNNRVRGTAAVEGDRLFIGTYSTDHAVLAINKNTGSLIWTYVLGNGVPVENSVAVADGIVYVIPSWNSPNNKIYALYANTPVGTYSETDPAIRKWSSTIGYGGENYGSEPVVADGKVFFAHYGGSPADYRVSALALTDGSLVWTYNFGGAYVGKPIVADGRLFVIQNKYLYCFGSLYPPVMYHFPVAADGHNYVVQLAINATPGALDTSTLITLKKITYTLQGIDGTKGMSNITIPNNMLGGPYTITVDGGLPLYSAPPVTNGTHTSLYFTYLHSSHTVEIIGTTVIPEYPIFLMLPMLIVISLIVIIAKKKLTQY